MADQPSAEEIHFRILTEQHFSALLEGGLHVLRDRGAWTRLWAAIVTDGPKDPPTVDWTAEMVIVVALGMRPHGGYGMEIRSITGKGGELSIHAVETRHLDRAVLAVEFQPFQAIATARHDGDVRLLMEVVDKHE